MWTNGAVYQYQPKDILILDNLLSADIGMELNYKYLFTKFIVQTEMFARIDAEAPWTLTTQENVYMISAGIKTKGIVFGIEHECWHPAIPWQPLLERNKIIPKHEGSTTRIYMQLIFTNKE